MSESWFGVQKVDIARLLKLYKEGMMIYEKDGTQWWAPDPLPSEDYIVDGSVAATASTIPGASVSTGNQTTQSETRKYSVYCAACACGLPSFSARPMVEGFVKEHSGHFALEPVKPMLAQDERNRRLAAIAYDKHHLPRTYPHKWEFDERELAWRCNCTIEPFKVSDAALAGFKG